MRRVGVMDSAGHEKITLRHVDAGLGRGSTLVLLNIIRRKGIEAIL